MRLIIFALLAACSTDAAPDCATATEHVSDCYGEEVASAFAESCTTESAKTALAESCPSAEGKEDN
jgi:hypothetical protein